MRTITFTFLLLLGSLTACTSTQVRRADGMKAEAKIGAGKSVVILDADVELSELTASGLQETRVDWTKAAKGFFDEFLDKQLRARSVALKPVVTVDDEAKAEHIKQLELLSQAVSYSVLAHEMNPYGKLKTKGKTFDWTIGPNAKLLREAYGADYALITLVRDSYSTGGRKALMILGVLAGAATGVGANVSLGQRVGYSTLIDLNTGKIVWVNLLVSGSGDLRNREGAEKAINGLLSGIPL